MASMTPEEERRHIEEFNRRLASHGGKSTDTAPSGRTSLTSKRHSDQSRRRFRCKSIGLECDFEATGESVSAVFQKIRSHLASVHGLEADERLIEDAVPLRPEIRWLLFSFVTAIAMLYPLTALDASRVAVVQHPAAVVISIMIANYFLAYYLHSADNAAVWFNRLQGVGLGLVIAIALAATLKKSTNFTTSIIVVGFLFSAAVIHRVIWSDRSLLRKRNRLSALLTWGTCVYALMYFGEALVAVPQNISNVGQLGAIRFALFLGRTLLLGYWSWLAYEKWQRRRFSVTKVEFLVGLSIVNVASMFWLKNTTTYMATASQEDWLSTVWVFTSIPAYIVAAVILSEYSDSLSVYRWVLVGDGISLYSWAIFTLMLRSEMMRNEKWPPKWFAIVSMVGSVSSVIGVLIRLFLEQRKQEVEVS